MFIKHWYTLVSGLSSVTKIRGVPGEIDLVNEAGHPSQRHAPGQHVNTYHQIKLNS